MLNIATPILRPLSKCGAEELAVHQFTARPSGGVLFSRKTDRSEKDAARATILELFTPDRFPGHLTMLTLPGIAWTFERLLLDKREGAWQHKDQLERTSIIGAECDRALFHAAIFRMPGVSAKRSVLSELPTVRWAERAMRGTWVDALYFCNVDDLMRSSGLTFDAAWIDYTGPLSEERRSLLRQFFQKSVRSTLIVTSLKARWNRQTSDAIERAGGVAPWLQRALPGRVLHVIEYQDGPAPMIQFAVAKE